MRRVGEGITAELSRNRDTLGRIRGNVGEVSGALDQARRILRSMGRREVRTKIAVAVFAVCMLAIIGGMIYWGESRAARRASARARTAGGCRWCSRADLPRPLTLCVLQSATRTETRNNLG